MDKTLILGGNGFIGSAIARRLAADGESVVIMDRSYPNIKNVGSILDKIDYIEKDFFNEKELIRSLSGVKNVIHCITSTYPGSANDNPVYDVETNIIGTIKLLDTLRQVDGIRLFFTSSGGTVYGRAKTLPIDEDHETNPICSYGICKLAIEKYLNMYHELYGLDYRIFRISNPYGETQDPRAGCGVIVAFLNNIMNKQRVHIWGDGESTRDYIHIDDVVDVFVKAIGSDLKHRMYNVGSGTGISLNELVNVIKEALGRDIGVAYSGGRSFDVDKTFLDTSRIRNELNWKPKVGLHEGIRRVWDCMLGDI